MKCYDETAMSIEIQHILVFILVGGCVAYAVRGAVQTLRGGKSRIGGCCAKGCTPQSGPSAKNDTEKVVFLPAEFLTKKSR